MKWAVYDHDDNWLGNIRADDEFAAMQEAKRQWSEAIRVVEAEDDGGGRCA